jgi:23S rRNA (uracil1939-C5)-methyltransferase
MPIDLNHQSGTPGFSDGADRAQPSCPHFGLCGGCQLQDLTYAAQLALKAARLRTLLAPAIEPSSLPELQFHPSPPLAYRNRIRLTLAEVAGQLRAGYLSISAANAPEAAEAPEVIYEGVISTEGGDSVALAERPPHFARSATKPSFLPITECPIAAPILWRTAEALLVLLNQRAPVWMARAPFRLDQLELFTSADESQLQLSLFARTSAKQLPGQFAAAFTDLCNSLHADIPELTGASIALLPPQSVQRSRRTEIARPGPTWSTPGLNYTVAAQAEIVTGIDEIVILSEAQNLRRSPSPSANALQPLTYWVPRGAFFQVNRFLLPDLLALVTANRSGALAWDLYAGVGLFTKALAPHFGRVTAVEVAEPSFTALTSNKLPNRQAVKDTTLDFLRRAVTDRDRPDLIVLDPPRTGTGAEICGLLARVAAPTVVYVSCSPETLPADLATLTASGYSVAELHLFDLFPQTTHIETVAILTRPKK